MELFSGKTGQRSKGHIVPIFDCITLQVRQKYWVFLASYVQQEHVMICGEFLVTFKLEFLIFLSYHISVFVYVYIYIYIYGIFHVLKMCGMYIFIY